MNFETIDPPPVPVGVTIDVEPQEIPHLLSAIRSYAGDNRPMFEGLIRFLTAVHQQNLRGGKTSLRPTLELPDLGGPLL